MEYKYIKIIETLLERNEEGGAAIIFKCDDGRSVTLAVPGQEDLNFDSSTPLTVQEINPPLTSLT